MATAISTGMPAERHPSKRDGWLVVLLWASAVVDLAVSAFLAVQLCGPAWWMVPLLAGVGVWTIHLLYSTDYTLDGDTLAVRSSFFRWRIPLADIDSVEPTTNPLSSPACSLDRLLIRYGKKRIMISPEDKAAFLHSLVTRAPHLELRGSEARRRG